jgi:hypothetical protein
MQKEIAMCERCSKNPIAYEVNFYENDEIVSTEKLCKECNDKIYV